MDNKFVSSFEYKLIYVFEIKGKTHKGLLKIGDATIKSDNSPDNLPPNCKALNDAAKNRIKQYTNTAGLSPVLRHTELAVRTVKGADGSMALKAFRDRDVHKVLTNSGIAKQKIGASTSREWFRVDLSTVLQAIEAVKKNQNNLSNTASEDFTPVVFRPEQEDAIAQTIKQFKHGSRMLWNAKMRFGKTLSALEVARKLGFKKTIIITHRPVVDKGWYEDFGKIFHGSDYIYGSKNSGNKIDDLLKQDKNFVYFASMQDLRGSETVGGKFNKNDTVFSLDWDFVIIDEAHEGTTTELGKAVEKSVVKENTKFLALSGTPFNIQDKYSDNIYTWDYVMEQRRKKNWGIENFGDSNPYDELPELKIYTYDLGDYFDRNKEYQEIEDKAFNFREFFRVYTGLENTPIPAGKSAQQFVHEDDIKSFLDLICKDNSKSCYPFANAEYREIFKHTLWMLPGVKEAKALSKLMKKHPVFGLFNIVNVAGDGDVEEESHEALKMVQDAIAKAEKTNGYTITLSCGRLTTGVTVPEWTGVFMLSGSFSTSAANYLQTIFRVQSPCNINGKVKRCGYVFDFAPDRTLKMVAESVAMSTKAGKQSESDRVILGEFLNFCPVIAVDGTAMKLYNTNLLLQQLKRAYAERAVQNGFDDNNLYNDELSRLDEIAIENFKNLKGIVGASKSSLKSNDVVINDMGFTNEEYEEIERIEKKPKSQRSAEEEEKLNKIVEQKKQEANARSILRGISIRMPLLIYGAEIDIDEDVTMEWLIKNIENASWDEFMPKGVTKKIFKEFMKYYDTDVFIAAGRKIRNIAFSADELPPTERVQKISSLFSCFKNPDKETVLTPWRVVNMHMGDCLGGYNFFDESYKELEEEPRFVDKGKVTADTFANKNAKILEINSKTGLYPLYATYSVFRSKCKDYTEEELDRALQDKLWSETVEQNIFVICQTPMAKSITKRTLVGFKDIKVNTRYFENLINMLKHKPEQFKNKVLRPSYWDVKGVTECFPNIDLSGGVCYFLWDGDNVGLCRITTKFNSKISVMDRPLLEKNMATFIRFNEAVGIMRKVKAQDEPTFDSLVSPRDPFGLNYYENGKEIMFKKFVKEPFKNSVAIYYYGWLKEGVSYVDPRYITTRNELLDKYKIYISKAYGERGNFPYLVTGKPFVGEPMTCCNMTYLTIGEFDKKENAENAASYMRTRFFRFLVLMSKNTQNAYRQVYSLVPIQDFSEPWTDEKLYAKYGLTEDEIAFVESMVRPMELGEV